jgi:hypothetical protein
MEDTFVLKIQLGNEEMQSGIDVANALRSTAAENLNRISGKLAAGEYGYVIDANGNNVGSWEIQ